MEPALTVSREEIEDALGRIGAAIA